jgi:hypothetical protein
MTAGTLAWRVQAYAEASRRVSTYGTLGLLGVNTALFIGTQLFLEPRKRKRSEAAVRAAVTEQGDRILAGMPAAAPAASPAGPGTAALHPALSAALADMDARRQQAEAAMLARLDAAMATHASRAALPAAVSSPSPVLQQPAGALATAGALAMLPASWRVPVATAWAALPPGPVTGARAEWVAGVAGVAAAGGLASGLLLAAIGAAAAGR